MTYEEKHLLNSNELLEVLSTGTTALVLAGSYKYVMMHYIIMAFLYLETMRAQNHDLLPFMSTFSIDHTAEHSTFYLTALPLLCLLQSKSVCVMNTR